MEPHRAPAKRRGFSLLELLCVIAVIAILAALLLPTLTKARDRAKQTQCAAQLKDIVVAFHSFAHDHNNQFPMQVPVTVGGSLMVAPRSRDNRVVGNGGVASRHFQALAAELRTPKMLICPADTRLPAVNFSVLSNQNVSYFAALSAEFGNANSLLAGDRNLTNDWAPPTSVQRVGPNYLLRWSPELHRFRGNLLFSDGHVDQTTDQGLRVLTQASGGRSYALNLPVLSSKPVTSNPLGFPTPSVAAAATGEKSIQQPGNPKLSASSGGSGVQNAAPPVSTERVTAPGTAPIPYSVAEPMKEKASVVPSSTNSRVALSSQQSEASYEAWFAGVIRWLKKLLWVFYLGLFLLSLLALLTRKHWVQEKEKRKAAKAQ